MFTAISMKPAEIKQGLVLRFTDGEIKFELVREGHEYRLNVVKYYGASFEDPTDVEYDDYNGIMVGTCKGLVDTVFADASTSLPDLVDRFYENERIFKEIFKII